MGLFNGKNIIDRICTARKTPGKVATPKPSWARYYGSSAHLAALDNMPDEAPQWIKEACLTGFFDHADGLSEDNNPYRDLDTVTLCTLQGVRVDDAPSGSFYMSRRILTDIIGEDAVARLEAAQERALA